MVWVCGCGGLKCIAISVCIPFQLQSVVADVTRRDPSTYLLTLHVGATRDLAAGGIAHATKMLYKFLSME